ncbi:thioether cross-link-forming SCIFF peptide maturase [Paenibacillus alvei]|uniref:Thioether cross-link-forming SCIFF peptide maturase n=1 Tax=Paenibacillus alvei TaxID=44250 RepID=A0ABT4H3S7_PAEAL|nr:thioether cross-link-forming SCIFF peptide maturase [Paenibacillus alvei]EJW19360.1 radical SAM domain protein [Paenibacillus alvei DSM 29]MCY7483751.1 thioether cross-link-forming SCIFF peptide maturase [Paenibacillus alvei]MCY9539342.1 thioether cross-link-forming SCIFF peptide maturase [Paenibacillus alvei]MCY9704766.1 thioether cross-link-forming SCIFF peptide maturase [Paenibacillus alvei]MCY9735955.1 thioether cross-link-forming SCIFF peptide maturase [Paenibacillus alvei]
MIHQYQLNGYNIVIDTYSGSVHVVDDLAYEIIALYEQETPERILALMKEKQYTEESIRGTISEVEELIKNEQLFTEDAYEELSIHLKARKTYVKALCLNVAHTCNLSCEYCFASQGKYNGDRAIMSVEVGQRAIDYLLENSGHHRNLDIDFFGGEPLMAWKVVKEIVKYARSKEKEWKKKFRFTFTTNGMLLNDEVTEFLNQEMYNVVLSLDGRKEVHDRLRTTVTGKGSYDSIVPKFQEFVQKRGDQEYYVRGTYTRNNVDFTNDIFHIADLGFDKISMEPVICDPREPYALTEKDLPEIYNQYEILAKEMIKRSEQGKGFTFYHYMLDLSEGPCIQKRITGCGSGTEYLAVTPWGELFPCHQFVGDEAYSMGNIWEGITRPELQCQFKESNCYTKPECQDCWAKLYCSGGCPANALHATGSINGTYEFSCDVFRKRIECSMMAKVAESIREMEENLV